MRGGPYELIGLQCPCGHDLYPYGIMRGTLWINLRFNVTDEQLVVLPREERRWFTPCGQRFVDTEPDHYRNGCFRMFHEQFAWSGAKCGACAVEKIKNETVLSSVLSLSEPVN